MLYYTTKPTYIQLGLPCYKITQSIKLVCSNVCNYKFVYFTIINQLFNTKCLHNRPDGYILNNRHYVITHALKSPVNQQERWRSNMLKVALGCFYTRNLVSIILFRMMIHTAFKIF